MTDITELALLVSKAKASVFTLKFISQFEPADIDSDDVDLRFEVDGIETGTNVSIVDECGQAAKVIDELVEALEKAQQRIGELERKEEALRTVGVMSEKAYHRLENRESRFIALWPRPEIYLPRKRPEDSVIVYARMAVSAGNKEEAE
ncbi:hypothetical protein ABUK00_11390 [Raoultella planticola]|uniref:hypothetical protein n=1 Tax=Raoultella planticola TaxID=575 RepID=UPI002AB4C999|nr:hypothetical protein [Raoultella planticola]MDY7621047.1 hypothetical protein [Raoultella planticola]